MSFQIKKATRQKQKIKILLGGVSGSGKTMSALKLARGMVDSWGKICVIDTENESAALYSHLGGFSIIPFYAPYSPERYIEALGVAQDQGFEVIIIDSITHEWDGRGGILDIMDLMKDKNSFAKWKKLTPRHNAFVDAVISAKTHIIATTRVKSDYVLSDKNGKQVPEKVGMKSITRDGVEYEFTLALDLDLRHLATSSKDRTSLFADIDPFVINEATGEAIIDWCNQGTEPVKEHSRPKATEQAENTGSTPGTNAQPNELRFFAQKLGITAEIKEFISQYTKDLAVHLELLKYLAKHEYTDIHTAIDDWMRENGYKEHA